MTIRKLHRYEVYVEGGPTHRVRTLAKARRLALKGGNYTEINRSVSEYYSDGSSTHGCGGFWVVWNGKIIKDPILNRRYRRCRVLADRPNKRGKITPLDRPFGFSNKDRWTWR